ncbi:MAG: hypothetical protein HYY49_11270 [Ignavibacteriales bacterium]|nr:hypothetical protein [Ignavibacteriales bacterium]
MSFQTSARIAISVACCFSFWKALAQPASDYALDPDKAISQFLHKVWQSEDGLPQNSITSLLQTQDGYLWIGTLEGLVRFDGARFTVFDKRNTPALKSNRIWSLCEDRQLNLWIGTENGGLTCFHNGSFETFDTSDGLLSNTVFKVYEDRKGSLWVGTFAGLNIKTNGRFAEFVARTALPRKPVWGICEDFRGTLWFGSTGIYSLDGNRFVRHASQDFSLSMVWALQFDSKDNLWIGSDLGLLKYKNGKFSSLELTETPVVPAIRSLLLDAKGSLWIGTDGRGLFRISNNRISTYSLAEGLSSNSVYALMQDREGSLWIGTNGGGLNQVRRAKFTSYTTLVGLSHDFVWSVCEDRKKNIWVGTYDGLTRLSGGSARVYSLADGLRNTFIWALHEDRGGQLWLGTNGGLVLFDGVTFKTYELNPDRSENIVRAILQDRRGNLWVGTSDMGLCLFRNGTFKSYTTKHGLGNNSVRAILEDSEGNLWVGTSSGLSKFRNGVAKTYSLRDGLSSDNIRCLYQDGDGTLWIGTDGGGLIRMKDGRFTAFTESEGLFDDVVSQILEDDKGNFWMSCNRGIFWIAKKELNELAEGKTNRISCVSYGSADGLKSQECNGGSQPAGWKSSDGRLWFPTVKGLAVINPNNIRTNRLPPPVVIEEIVADSTRYANVRSVDFSPGAERFEFHYTALSFVATEKIQFRYKLEGVDKAWINAGNRRVAYYTNIPPGEYFFKVSAANSDGVWNFEGSSVALNVRPRFLQTRVFRFLSALLVGAVVFGVYRMRVQHLRTREAELKELVEKRTTDLLEQTRIAKEASKFKSQLLSLAAHDLKSPLISIRGFIQLLRDDITKKPDATEKADLIQHLSQNMITLVNELLESAALEDRKIQLFRRPVDISLLALAVTDLNKHYADQKGQRLHASLDDACIVEVDAGRMQEAMENLVSNAIKYSPHGKNIYITVERKNSSVVFSVRDEGPGLTAEDKQKLFERFQRLSSRPTGDESSTGLGLFIVKQIVELHGGKVWVEGQHGMGSTFLIELPTASPN